MRLSFFLFFIIGIKFIEFYSDFIKICFYNTISEILGVLIETLFVLKSSKTFEHS